MTHSVDEDFVKRKLSEILTRAEHMQAIYEAVETELSSANSLLREVLAWRALDGDGISQPLLDRVRVHLGLDPEEE